MNAITEIAPEDRARAELYDFLARLLSHPPDRATLSQCAALGGDAETALGRAIARIAEAAAGTDAAAAERAFNRLFIGLGRGEFLPYASYYLTGNLHDTPLARLRSDMRTLRIERAPNVFEPEDNIASLMEMMAGQILGRYGVVEPVKKQKAFFAAHVGPWAGRFFSELAGTDASPLYAAVGELGAAFMRIESEAFALTD